MYHKVSTNHLIEEMVEIVWIQSKPVPVMLITDLNQCTFILNFLYHYEAKRNVEVKYKIVFLYFWFSI